MALREVSPRQTSERTYGEQASGEQDGCPFQALLVLVLHFTHRFRFADPPAPLVTTRGHHSGEEIVGQLEKTQVAALLDPYQAAFDELFDVVLGHAGVR